MRKNYIPSLDGIRTIAVFLVLFSHAGLGHIVPGGLGVTIFFFLSGFLITTLLIFEFDRTNKINYLYFFARRFFRLFPPLVVTLLVSYLLYFVGLLGGGISYEGLFSQLFYLANYHSIFMWPGDIPDGLGILWSLAVEEHFYLFFPLLFYLSLAKLSHNKVAVMLGFSCLIILLWRIYLVFFEHVPIERVYYATDTRIDSILYGSLLAITFNPVGADKNVLFSFKAILLIAVSVVLLLLSLFVRGQEFRETIRYSIQGVALMPLFYYSIKCYDHPLFRWLNWSWMRILGIYSYFIYLIHEVVIQFLKLNDIAASTPKRLLWAVIISIGYAFLIDKYIDVHFMKIRKKYRC